MAPISPEIPIIDLTLPKDELTKQIKAAMTVFPLICVLVNVDCRLHVPQEPWNSAIRNRRRISIGISSTLQTKRRVKNSSTVHWKKKKHSHET